MKIFNVIVYLVFVFNLHAQATFIKVIDMGETDESAFKITPNGENLLISYSQSYDTTHNSGLLELSKNGEIQKDARFSNYNFNMNSFLFDYSSQKILYFDIENPDTIPEKFQILTLDHSTLKIVNSLIIENGIRHFSNSTIRQVALVNNQIVIVSLSKEYKRDIAVTFINKESLKIDTTLSLNHNYDYTGQTSMFVDHNGDLNITATFAHEDHLLTIYRIDANKAIFEERLITGSCYTPYSEMRELSDQRKITNKCETILFFKENSLDEVDKFELTSHYPKNQKNFEFFRSSNVKMLEMHNGDIIAIGSMLWHDPSSNDKYKISPYIYRINSNGDFLWQKAFFKDWKIKAIQYGLFFDAVELIDGSIMIVGEIVDDVQFDHCNNASDILIVRMSADGCIDGYDCESLLYKVPDATRLTTGTQDTDVHDEGKMGIYIYPNPATDRLNINIPTNAVVSTTQMTVEIFNSLGSKVMEQSLAESQNIVDISALATGLHYIKIKNKDRTVVTSKFIKL